jgi:hypothetical protein
MGMERWWDSSGSDGSRPIIFCISDLALRMVLSVVCTVVVVLELIELIVRKVVSCSMACCQ